MNMAASNLQSFNYLQRSSDLIDVQNLPITTDFRNPGGSTNTSPQGVATGGGEFINVRQYEFNGRPPPTPQSRMGSSKLQRKTSSKMQRPNGIYGNSSNQGLPQQHQSMESFRIVRGDSMDMGPAPGTPNTRAYQREGSLLRLRKTSTEQAPPGTPNNTRNAVTSVSPLGLHTQNSELRLMRKHSMGSMDRQGTPQERGDKAKVRRHTSLSPRTLKNASQNVSQRLVIDNTRENSDLFITNGTTTGVSKGNQSSQTPQMLGQTSQWKSSESFNSYPVASNAGGGLPQESVSNQNRQQSRVNQNTGGVQTDKRVAPIQSSIPQRNTEDYLELHAQKSSESFTLRNPVTKLDSSHVTKMDQNHMTSASSPHFESNSQEHSNLTISSLRFSAIEFDDMHQPGGGGHMMRKDFAPNMEDPQTSTPLSVEQKQLHRLVFGWHRLQGDRMGKIM